MSDKTTKADLLKMLAEAVLNTPGATQLPIRDAQPAPEVKPKPVKKRPAKIKKPKASSNR